MKKAKLSIERLYAAQDRKLAEVIKRLEILDSEKQQA